MAVSRRDALTRLTLAGAGVAVSPIATWGQASPITVNGRPVSIAVASVSPATVRISVLPLAGDVAQPVVNQPAMSGG